MTDITTQLTTPINYAPSYFSTVIAIQRAVELLACPGLVRDVLSTFARRPIPFPSDHGWDSLWKANC